MPAAAVKRRGLALPGFTRRKACVGVLLGFPLNFEAQLQNGGKYRRNLRDRGGNGTDGVGVKSVDTIGNTKGEGNFLAVF